MGTRDPAAAYRKLRDETASMLGLGAELSMIENLQVDLLALLRLSVTDLQGAALAGQDIDLDRLSEALSLLLKLLPEAALQAQPVAPPSDGDDGDTLEEFERLLTNIREAKAFEEASELDKARAELHKARAEIERITHENEQLKAAAQSASAPASAAPSPQAPAPADPKRVVPLHRSEGFRVGEGREPWRGYVSENGIHTSARFPWTRSY
jgi:hypothetical protein